MKFKILKLATAAFAVIALLSGCDSTTLKAVPAELGKTSSMEQLRVSLTRPGIIDFAKHVSAEGTVDLSDVLNLEHPKAIEAGLEDRLEPIEIYLFSLSHPSKGNYFVDSGVSEKWLPGSTESDLSFLVEKAMGSDAFELRNTTKSIADQLTGGINGVFLTHIHIDHILGISDLPAGTKVFIGPGDARLNHPINAITQGSTDRLLANAGVLREWQYEKAEGEQMAVIDIFGDGSVWAIHAPGHSPGSTAYLVNSTEGPQLLTGDACHTRWGWIHQVEPGNFSVEREQSVVSLNMLEQLVKEFPQIKVHMGHQSLIE